MLLGIHGFRVQHRLYGGAQVCAGNGDIVLWPAAVQLTAVNQQAALVEEEKIGRACRLVGARHFLRFVVAVWETEALFPRLAAQAVRAVLGNCAASLEEMATIPRGRSE